MQHFASLCCFEKFWAHFTKLCRQNGLCLTSRAMIGKFETFYISLLDKNKILMRFLDKMLTAKSCNNRRNNFFKKNIIHNYKYFLTRASVSSFPRIYAISNAPGENCSPESATRSGHKTWPFFFSASAIFGKIVFFIASKSE